MFLFFSSFFRTFILCLMPGPLYEYVSLVKGDFQEENELEHIFVKFDLVIKNMFFYFSLIMGVNCSYGLK